MWTAFRLVECRIGLLGSLAELSQAWTSTPTSLSLVESIGLNPVYVGPLSRARQLEGLAFLNITLNVANGGNWHSGWKLVGAPGPVPTAA